MTVHHQGALRGSKSKFLPDGQVVVSIWYPIDPDDDELGGYSFDIDIKDLDDVVKLLRKLEEAEAEEVKEDGDDQLYWEAFGDHLG